MNKQKFFLSVFSIYLMIIISGCASVQQSLYLGNAKVEAPVTVPPTHVMFNGEVGSVRISPKLLINTQKQIDAATENRYSKKLKFTNGNSMMMDSKNLQWKISRVQIGTDIDATVSKNFTLFGGVNFATGNTSDLFGGHFGIGFYGTENNHSYRLDIGASFQNYSYNAFTILVTNAVWIWGGKSTDTSYYSDKNTEVNFNPFISLTYNSCYKDSPINFFVSAGYFTQNLLGFEPHGTEYDGLFLMNYTKTDNRPDCKVGFLFFNPGIIYTASESMKMIASLKICQESTLDKISPSLILIPALQLNFEL